MRRLPFALLIMLMGAPLTAQSQMQTAVLAGGCFWGVELVFEHVKGVTNVVSGYSGGTRDEAIYELVGTSTTGHAESVRITFDPSIVSYEALLKVFFTVTHNPTELNRQGPDVGPQYRSVVFYRDAEQKRIAESMIAELIRSKRYANPIVTELAPLNEFFDAEDYHQDYARYHPNDPYIVFNDEGKVDHLRAAFPELFREETKR